jgi:TIR domain
MAAKIFISYRRDDSAPHALSIAQYLERTFGARNVFIDVDRLRAGQTFPAVLEEKLAGCRVMLVVIGPTWLTVTDDNGIRRLNDPADWVRLEITRALARGVSVIPVLVGGAKLPRNADLPPDLQPLVDRHAAVVTTNGFRQEMAGLERDIRLLEPPMPWRKIAACLTAVLGAALAVAYLTTVLRSEQREPDVVVQPAPVGVVPTEFDRETLKPAPRRDKSIRGFEAVDPTSDQPTEGRLKSGAFKKVFGAD